MHLQVDLSNWWVEETYQIDDDRGSKISSNGELVHIPTPFVDPKKEKEKPQFDFSFFLKHPLYVTIRVFVN